MSDTLREYLIGLGFKIDEASWRKFNSGVARAASEVTALGAEAVATGLAIGAMVERIARENEALYYQSMRTGASVANLKAYGYAAKQVGIDATDMQSAIEQFGMTQRLNPGVAALVRGFSGATDKAQQFLETMQRLRSMPFFMASAIAQTMGINDPKLLLQIFQELPRYEREIAEAKRLQGQAGYDANQGAKDFTEFGRQINHLEEVFGTLTTRIAHDFLPIASAVVQAIDDMAQAFTRLNTDTEGKAGIAATVAGTGLSAVLLKKLLAKLFGRKAAAAAAATGAETAAGIGVGGLALAGGLAAAGLVASTTEANKGEKPFYKFDPVTGKWVPVEQPPSSLPEAPPGGAAPGASGGATANLYHRAETAEGELGNVKGMNAELVERLRRMRADMPTDAKGFSVTDGFRSYQQQAELYRRKPNLAAPPGHSRHEHGEAADLKFGSKEAEDWMHQHAGEYGVKFPMYPARPGHKFEPWHAELDNRMKGDLAPAPTGGDSHVTLEQKTEIHVAPGPSSLDTARRVMDAQRDVNGDAVRNLGAKVR